MTLHIPSELPNFLNFYPPKYIVIKKKVCVFLPYLILYSFLKKSILSCAFCFVGRRQVSVPIVLSNGLVRMHRSASLILA